MSKNAGDARVVSLSQLGTIMEDPYVTRVIDYVMSGEQDPSFSEVNWGKEVLSHVIEKYEVSQWVASFCVVCSVENMVYKLNPAKVEAEVIYAE